MKQIARNYLTFLLIVGAAFGQFAEDEFDKYTVVSQLGMTVTNYGVLGNGWNKIYGEILPSCQYRQHTEILREQIEHFSFAGLWVGGIANGSRRVSTSIVDGVFESGLEGFEFFASSAIKTRSSISSTSDDPMAKYFSLDAVSHQDMLMDFQDYGQVVDNHDPLGINVHLETYSWNFTFADAFTILNYIITNASIDTIKDIYAGLWVDASIANMNYTNIYEPGGGFSWYDNLDGFDETEDDAGFARDIGFQYDADGDDGWAQSYIGITMLGGTVPRPYIDSYYHQWTWSSSVNTDYPAYAMPMTDIERYETMSNSVPMDPPGTTGTYKEGYPDIPNSWLFQLSAGPLGSQPANMDSTSWELPPGESCQIVFAVVTAPWSDGGSATKSPSRADLHVNMDWAQKAYDGEDKNRNNILDDDEDTDHNGELDRYILPEPPPKPNMTVEVGDQKVTIYWSANAESFIDPVSQEKDFEGYRIYSAHKTVGGEMAEFTLLGEFDIYNENEQNIGFNTGLDGIRITDENGNPDTVNIDNRDYHYKFENKGVKNGWLNYYSVTAYDRGDPEANLASLESSITDNRRGHYVYPGIVPKADSSWAGDPSVYPNPYRGQAKWDGYGSRDRMIWFSNLPPRAEIRIFTLAGDQVDVIQHDSEYKGEDVRNIKSAKDPLMSGGEHAWDLISQYDQAIASGLYLFTVKNLDTKVI
ncbi:MAG: hypothetical protein H8E14_02785, partial [Candidatus Marinimicrobia bacterium]|nr:hypothetical protein [Candidatus Neomarinimicrobiota bacterium]